MQSSNSLVEEWHHSIRKMNGMQPGVEMDDWQTASNKQAHAGAVARQLDKSSSQEVSHLLEAVLEHSPAVISVKDARGRYLLVNGQFESLYQVSQDELGNITDYDLFPTDQADTLRANDLQVIATRQPLEFEEVVRGPTDTSANRTYLSLKFPIAGPDGSPNAVGGISTDITERKRDQRCLLIQYAVTRALLEAATDTDAEPAILQAVCASLGWDVGLLWRVDPVADVLRCVEVWQAPDVNVSAIERMGRGMTLSSGVGLAGRAWDTGQPIWIEDVATTDNLRAVTAAADFMRGGCAFPIRNGGNILGVVEVFSYEIQYADTNLLKVLTGIGSQFSEFIERRQAERTLHERAREFDLARTIQLGLLPKSPPVLAGFSIDGASHPAQETGGDYLDFVPMRGETLGIAIGDASGHGIAAALVMTEARAYLRARATTDLDVGGILTLVNRQLTEDWPENHFVTMFFARLDGPTRTLTYSSAGHLSGIVLDDQGKVRRILGSTNLPLGVDPTTEYVVAPSVVLEPGDLVLLLTDGIQEAHSHEGQMFGIERAIETVRAIRHETPCRIIEGLLHAVHEFSAGHQTDDLSAIVLKVDR